jgi:hypothetical protein
MQSTDQVTPATLELAQAEAAVAVPTELSLEMLALVAGGSPRGGWIPPEALVVAPSPRGGW